ncbi:hypothetical protein Btru_000342 [Bulinus truncatus]|nr:hypothetical protein Btru_000342 [Bulinus truncatus]
MKMDFNITKKCTHFLYGNMEERKRLRQIEMDREEEIKKRKIMEKERELREKEAALRAIQHVATQPVQETHAMTALQKELAAARQREEQQRQLIQRIQQQNKQMEEQRNSLLQMAESLQTLKGKKPKDALDQMNQIIETLSPSLSAIGNRRQIETSSPAAARKIVKPLCIKTETGEVSSITQSNENGRETGYIGSKDSAVGKPNKASANRFIPPKELKPKVSSGFISNKPDQKIVNGHTPKKTDNQSEMQVQTPRRTRQRHKAEKVLAVIDLTSDKEYGELVDIKPDLEELRSSLQDNLRSNTEDVKPDKKQLDAVIGNNGTVKEGSSAATNAKAVREAKKEIMDTSYSDVQQPDGKNKNSNNNENPLNPEIPVNLEDNIEAAMAAIQEKMEKEKFRKKELSVANDSQVPPFSGSKNTADRPKRLNSESSLDSLPGLSDSDCDKTNGVNIKEERDEQSLIKRLQLSVNQMSDDEDMDAFDNSNDHSPILFSQPVDKKCENKTEASHEKDDNEIFGGHSNAQNEIDNVNICDDREETSSNKNRLVDDNVVSSIINESPAFENRNSPKINDTEADHNFQAYNSADEDTYCSSGEESLNIIKDLVFSDTDQLPSKDSNNSECSKHEVDLVEKIGDGILKDIVSLKQTAQSKDSKPNSVDISSTIDKPTLPVSSLIFCKPCDESPGDLNNCSDLFSNSNVKTSQQMTKVMDHNICNSKGDVFHKETQTTEAEVQTEKSSFGTECDLEEQLVQTKNSLAETTLKLNKFYSDVQRLLRLSNPELVVVEGDDIEQIIQNLIEMKQEPHTNGET